MVIKEKIRIIKSFQFFFVLPYVHDIVIIYLWQQSQVYIQLVSLEIYLLFFPLDYMQTSGVKHLN